MAISWTVIEEVLHSLFLTAVGAGRVDGFRDFVYVVVEGWVAKSEGGQEYFLGFVGEMAAVCCS